MKEMKEIKNLEIMDNDKAAAKVAEFVNESMPHRALLSLNEEGDTLGFDVEPPFALFSMRDTSFIPSALELMKKSGAKYIALSGMDCDIVYFDEDGGEFKDYQMLHQPELWMADNGGLWIVDRTKHGDGMIFSDPFKFEVDEPEDQVSVSFTVGDVFLAAGDKLLTTQTAKDIINHFKGREGVSSDDILDACFHTQTLPKAYYKQAEDMGITQWFDDTHVSNVPQTTLLFFEAINQGVSPEKIGAIVEQALTYTGDNSLTTHLAIQQACMDVE